MSTKVGMMFPMSLAGVSLATNLCQKYCYIAYWKVFLSQKCTTSKVSQATKISERLLRSPRQCLIVTVRCLQYDSTTWSNLKSTWSEPWWKAITSCVTQNCDRHLLFAYSNNNASSAYFNLSQRVIIRWKPFRHRPRIEIIAVDPISIFIFEGWASNLYRHFISCTTSNQTTFRNDGSEFFVVEKYYFLDTYHLLSHDLPDRH